MKVIAMVSGGLDSVLAAKVMMNLGFDVLGVSMIMPFGLKSEKPSDAQRMSEKISLPLMSESRGDHFMEMVRNPRHGYGKNVNPCIDCRIMMLARAKEIMKEQDASFIITGEVVGQRPMSQRRDAMNLIDKEADVKGWVLRPLCAKNLDPTIPETEGWVERESLYDFSGRNRTPQIELAARLEIEDYPAPAGGCCLTEQVFGKRLKHLFSIKDKTIADDWSLLSVGRHLTFGPRTKAVISRNEKENYLLKNLSKAGDCIIEPENFPGPTAMIVGPYNESDIRKVGQMILRYGKQPLEGPAEVSFSAQNKLDTMEINNAASDDQIAPLLIH